MTSAARGAPPAQGPAADPATPDARAEPAPPGATSEPGMSARQAASATPGMGGVARGSTANLAGAFVMAAANLVLSVAVTRGLPREAAGIFFSATSLFLLATTVGQLGTNTGLVYFLARCRSLGQTGAIPAYFRAALRPVLVTATLMAILLYLLAPQIAGVTTPHHVAETTRYLRVLALFIPFVGLENVALAATRGLGSMRVNATVEQLARPGLQVLLVVGAISFSGSALLSWAWVFAYLPAGVAAYLWWRRMLPRAVTASEPPAQAARVGREFWRFTSPRALASVGQIAMQRLDIVLVGALAGVVNAAIYTAATRFLVVGQMGQRAISLAVQPRLGEALAQKDTSSTNHYYQISTAWLMLVTWPLYCTLIVFGEPLLSVFGKGYNAGIAVLVVLSCSMLIGTGCGMVDMVLTMAGRTSWNLYNVATALAVNLGLDLWLIPTHGVLGASIGWAVAIVVANVVPLAQVGLVMGLHPFGRPSTLAALLSLGCYGGVEVVLRQGFGASWLALLAALVIATLAYGAGLWHFREALYLTVLREGRKRARR